MQYVVPVLMSFCLGVLLACVLSASARGHRAEQAYWHHALLAPEDGEPPAGFGGLADDGPTPELPF
jgi:hypothetical protein